MLPALAALGIAGLSAADLIKQIYRANTKPDPKEVESIIDNKAINISRREGVPVDMVREQIREDTIKEIMDDREFSWPTAAFAALGMVPGGMVAKGLGAAAKAAGAGGEMAAAKGALGEMTGLGGSIGRRTPKGAASAHAPEAIGKGAAPAPAPEAIGKVGPSAKTAGATVKDSDNVAEDVEEYGKLGRMQDIEAGIAQRGMEARRASRNTPFDELANEGIPDWSMAPRQALPIDVMPGMPGFIGDVPGYLRAAQGKDDMFQRLLAQRLHNRYASTAGMGD